MGAWQAELAEWAQLMMSAHGSARALAQVVPLLQVNPQRMREHIDAVSAQQPRDVAHEWFSPQLADAAAPMVGPQVNALRQALALTAADMAAR